MNNSKKSTFQSRWTTSQLINLSQSLASAYGCEFTTQSSQDTQWLQKFN